MAAALDLDADLRAALDDASAWGIGMTAPQFASPDGQPRPPGTMVWFDIDI